MLSGGSGQAALWALPLNSGCDALCCWLWLRLCCGSGQAVEQAHAAGEVARCDLRVGVSAASVQDTCIEGLSCVCDL